MKKAILEIHELKEAKRSNIMLKSVQRSKHRGHEEPSNIKYKYCEYISKGGEPAMKLRKENGRVEDN